MIHDQFLEFLECKHTFIVFSCTLDCIQELLFSSHEFPKNFTRDHFLVEYNICVNFHGYITKHIVSFTLAFDTVCFSFVCFLFFFLLFLICWAGWFLFILAFSFHLCFTRNPLFSSFPSKFTASLAGLFGQCSVHVSYERLMFMDSVDSS